MFHEDWYSDDMIKLLCECYDRVSNLSGKIVEIGCWEGKSTIAIANKCYPEIMIAVDHWMGNINEKINHETVQVLSVRDVYCDFLDNIRLYTKNNIQIKKQDCFLFLDNFKDLIKFCHVDACHNYEDVLRTLNLIKPLIVKNGVVCGDDFGTANIGRLDLNGGVERAVKEALPEFESNGNFWYWINK